MKHICLILLAAIYLALGVQCTSADVDVVAATQLSHRLLGDFASNIKFEKAPAADADYFTVSSDGSKIYVSGNNANSMAMGLNYFLKNHCHVSISWYKDDAITIPGEIPVVDAVTVSARVPNRFFLNYCTFGYTMPWWKWSDWEHFIDWMALNGINMPLAITGQESIWYNVWTKLGLSDEEVRSYFTGPAHLPWHRMCNLDRWQGPLPKEWLDNQADLQKKIVTRERELNMRPVLPGFAGHVPEAITRLFPDAKTTRVSKWGGFADEYRCTYLSPTDSLFSVIQHEYLAEQTKLYGTDHIYGIDPFNEVDPPTWDADTLGLISRRIYESVADVDSDAVWLQMAWFLYADATHWTPERTKSFLQGVPQGKMILLDYFCENTELWKMYDKFYGQPYIWCYLGNFGGNTFLAGSVAEVSNRLNSVYADGGSNLAGVGSTLEGLDLNPYMYEYLFDRAWNITDSEESMISSLAYRRAGMVSGHALKAWTILVNKVYVDAAVCGCGTLTNARPCLKGNGYWTTHTRYSYSNADLVDAWGELIKVEGATGDAYEFDIVNLGRQALGNYFMVVRDRFADSKSLDEMRANGDAMKEILADMTELLACHHTFSMKKWIDDARDFGADDASKDYYETNARTLVTVWGDSDHLTDYANRSWAELNNQYYAARWNMFIDRVVSAYESGTPFDEKAFFNSSRELETGWIDVNNNVINYLPEGDAAVVARKMYDKYADAMRQAAQNQ